MQVLASIGQLEFFYDQAPDIMRSCSMALQLLSVAVGSYLSGAVVYAVGAVTARLGYSGGQGWLPKDMNHGRLDLFFLLLAGEPTAHDSNVYRAEKRRSSERERVWVDCCICTDLLHQSSHSCGKIADACSRDRGKDTVQRLHACVIPGC